MEVLNLLAEEIGLYPMHPVIGPVESTLSIFYGMQKSRSDPTS